MNEYTAETTEPVQVGDTLYRLVITYDPHYPYSPREDRDTHMGVMAAHHRSYNLPAEDDTNPRQPHNGLRLAGLLDARRVYGMGSGMSFRAMRRWLRMFHGASVVLPIYATGHDDRLWAGDLADDGKGACGLIYDTPDTRRRGWGDDSSPATWVTVANLRAEVEQYATWAAGEMTEWAVERCDLAPGEDADDVREDDDRWAGTGDSCCGYYSVAEARECGEHDGLNPVVEDARQALVDELKEDAELRIAEMGGAA